MSQCVTRYLEAARQVARQRERVLHYRATYGPCHSLTRNEEEELRRQQEHLATLNDCGE